MDKEGDGDKPSSISRRDFLKLGGAALLGLAGSRFVPRVENQEVEMVRGIEVFGLKDKLDSQDKIDNLTLSFDLGFDYFLIDKLT